MTGKHPYNAMAWWGDTTEDDRDTLPDYRQWEPGGAYYQALAECGKAVYRAKDGGGVAHCGQPIGHNTPCCAPYTLADVGCYVDGARGIYAIDAIVVFAISHGMEEADPCDCFEHPENDFLPHHNRCEFAGETEDECDEYLNAQYSVDGAYWGRSDGGDWGLWATEEECHELDNGATCRTRGIRAPFRCPPCQREEG